MVSYEGVKDFYISRIMCAMTFSLHEGDQWLGTILSAISHDSMLTDAERNSIINLCEIAHNKLLEDDFNEGWK